MPRRRIRPNVVRHLRTCSLRLSAMAVFVGGSGASLGAQDAPAPVPAPDLSFLAPIGAPTAAEISALESGEVVVRPVGTADRDEVALLGLVSVAVPRDVMFARSSSATASLAEAGRQPSGVVSSPAAASNFAQATLDPSDAAGVRKCQVARCSLKLPREQMEAIAGAVDWSRESGVQRTAHVETLLREWLAKLVNDYRTRGDAALPVYDDTRRGEWSAAGFRSLLQEDAFLFRDAPAFAAYLAGSPSRAVPNVTSALFWAVDRRPGLKPILNVSQLSSFAGDGTSAPRLVAVKQLYASHYFDSWLDVTALLEQPGAVPHTCLVFVRRVRFDKLPNRGLFDVRGRIVRKLRDALHDELDHAKQAAEAAYHAP